MSKKKLIFLFTVVLIFLVLQIFTGVLYNNSGLDEGKYLLKSYWYVNGDVKPYSSEDYTGHMPIYFYVLGLWQKTFGPSHISGRVLSALLTIINLYLLGYIIYGKTHNFLYSLLAVAVIVFNPYCMFYYTTATPYALVSLWLLLSIIILERIENNTYCWSFLFGVVLFLLYFTRRNTVLLIIPLLIIEFLILKNKRAVFLTITTFVISTICILLIFNGRLPALALSFPIITPLIRNIMVKIHLLFNGEGTGLAGGVAPVVEYIAKDRSASFSIKFVKSTIEIFIAYLIPLSASFFVVVTAFFKKNLFDIKNLMYSLLFIFAFIGHWIPSLSYCPRCILPYTNYFIFLGAIVFSMMLYNLKNDNYFNNNKKYLIYGFISAVFIFSFYLSMSERISEYSSPKYSWVKRVKEVAGLLKKNIPDGERYVPIGGLYYTVHASLYSGHIPEVNMINQNYTYKRTINKELVTASDILNLDNSSGMWTDELMEYWIESKHDYFLIGNGPFTDKYLPLIEQKFEIIDNIKIGKKININLYKRK